MVAQMWGAAKRTMWGRGADSCSEAEVQIAALRGRGADGCSEAEVQMAALRQRCRWLF